MLEIARLARRFALVPSGIFRLSLGAHFPADVLSGYLVALGTVAAVRIGIAQVQRLTARRFLPT